MKFFRSTEFIIAGVLLAAMVIIGTINPAFWSLDNIFGLLRSNVVIGIMALGVLLVMISGGIDVSFTAFAIAAMYLTVRAMVYLGYDGVLVPFVAATLIGLALGAFNGFIIHRFRMIPLIVTLGTGSIVRGLVLGLVGTSIVNINKMPKELIGFGKTDVISLTSATGSTFGLTAMFVVYMGLALVIHLVLTYTMIGRSVYAYGGSPEAAKRVGFNTGATIFFVYCVAGALAGFSGLLHSSMIWLANPRDFVGLELDVIAAVVLGGASIFGGRGTVLGTLMGVFMLVMVKNSLIIMKVDTTWQRVVVGLIIIVAIAAVTGLGLNYRSEDAAAGSVASVRVGDRTIASYPAEAADAAAQKTRLDAELKQALTDAGYPLGNADPAFINEPAIVALLCVLLALGAMVFAPTTTSLLEMFPSRIRYTAMSFPYHLSAAWFGGFLPATAFAIVAATGNVYSGLYYPVGIAAACMVLSLIFARETRGTDISKG